MLVAHLSLLHPIPVKSETSPPTARSSRRLAPKRVKHSAPVTLLRYAIQVSLSSIDGRGVFAREPIPARRKIGEIGGRIISLVECRRLYRGKKRMYYIELTSRHAFECKGRSPLQFLNHSCQANAYLRIIRRRIEVHSRTPIAVGAEITVNYGETPHPGGMSCQCGATGCQGKL